MKDAATLLALADGDWRKCRIGSCSRHKACMYAPCRSGEKARAHAAIATGEG